MKYVGTLLSLSCVLARPDGGSPTKQDHHSLKKCINGTGKSVISNVNSVFKNNSNKKLTFWIVQRFSQEKETD